METIAKSMHDLAVITRFHYPKDHPKFDWRFDFYRRETLPRLLNQTDQNFDIWVWTEPHHDELFKALHPRVNVFHGTYDERDSHLFIDYTPFERIEGLPKYPIQFGLDSDDLLEPTAIAKARHYCRGQFKTFVSLQPLKLDIATGKKYYFDPRRRYTQSKGSPVFAFYQPRIDEDFVFAYHTSHLRMPTVAADQHVVVPEGFVNMAIHGQNDSTNIRGRDILCS